MNRGPQRHSEAPGRRHPLPGTAAAWALSGVLSGLLSGALSMALAGIAAPAAAAAAGAVEVRVVDRAGQPLAGAVVTLESPAARAAVRPAQGLEMEQKDRQFVPEVMVVPLGTELRFPNRDRVRHHVYSISPAKTFELKLFIGNEANPVHFDRAGVAVLGCNIHDEMVGWVVVVPTPYYAITGADGRARLDAPAAAYQLLVWHPELPVGAPALAHAVKLHEGTAPVTVTLPLGRGS